MVMDLLGSNLEHLKANFKSVTGKPFKHFYCPILHADQDVPLSDGHIVPQSLGGRLKVVQRSDIDNRFGSFFESEAVDAIKRGLDTNPLDVVSKADPAEIKDLGRRFKVNLLLEGADKPVEVRISKMGGVGGFYVKNQVLNDALGRDPGDHPVRGSIEVELDARSSILVTSLRASHLAWFRICGYRYVFSKEGVFVAGVLRDFYRKFIVPQRMSGRKERGLMSKEVKRQVNEYCLQFANLSRPATEQALAGLPNELGDGIPDSGGFLALWDRDQIYGRISIVKLGSQRVAVLTPVITDPRGWALICLAANLELEFSAGWFDAEADRFRIDPPNGTLIWPSSKEETSSSPPINIRDAAQLVINSGRMK